MAIWRYELHGWRRAADSDGPTTGFVMRPGRGTVLLRLRVTLVSAALIAMLIFITARITRDPDGNQSSTRIASRGNPDDQALSRRISEMELHLSPDARRRIEQERSARAQQHAATQ